MFHPKMRAAGFVPVERVVADDPANSGKSATRAAVSSVLLSIAAHHLAVFPELLA
jgi:hypothetical protein